MPEYITKQQALDVITDHAKYLGGWLIESIEADINGTEPKEVVEPIYCKDCRKHNKGLENVKYKADACPLVQYRGKAQGHEFDYQFCVYWERKEDG